MNYVVSVNEAKRTIEVVIDGKYKGVAKCCKSDSYNLQVGIELALERAKVAKANAEKPKAKTVADMSVRELAAIIERKLRKGEVVVIGEGRVPSANQKAVLHSLTDCKGISADERKAIADNAYDEGYAEGYDEGYEAALAESSNDYDLGYADGYDDAVNDCEACDEDCDCDEGCDCDCHKIVASQGVVVMSGEGAISGDMIRKLIEQCANSLK